MVLQRRRAGAVWGTSECAQVVVELHGANGAKLVWSALSATSRAAGGTVFSWEAALPAQEAGTGFAIRVRELCQGGAERMLEDLLFGDVFLCSGQSNMERAVGKQPVAGEQAVRGSGNLTGLRHYSVAAVMAGSEQASVGSRSGSGWVRSGPAGFGDRWPSAACWFFGRELYSHFGGAVPVGLISAAVTGLALSDFAPADALSDASCGGLGPVANVSLFASGSGAKLAGEGDGQTQRQQQQHLQQPAPQQPPVSATPSATSTAATTAAGATAQQQRGTAAAAAAPAAAAPAAQEQRRSGRSGSSRSSSSAGAAGAAAELRHPRLAVAPCSAGGGGWDVGSARGSRPARVRRHGAMKTPQEIGRGAQLSALSCCFYSTSEALNAGQLLVLTAATSGC